MKVQRNKVSFPRAALKVDTSQVFRKFLVVRSLPNNFKNLLRDPITHQAGYESGSEL
jgi:hypothetical protein